jgi:hypothetical protein
MMSAFLDNGLTARLPVEIHDSEIVEEVSQVTFAAIAERLAALGFPVTGDFAPDEVIAIDRVIEAFIGAMALNNPEIQRLNEEEA